MDWFEKAKKDPEACAMAMGLIRIDTKYEDYRHTPDRDLRAERMQYLRTELLTLITGREDILFRACVSGLIADRVLKLAVVLLDRKQSAKLCHQIVKKLQSEEQEDTQ